MIRFLYAFKYYFYNSFITRMPGYGFRRWYLNSILKYKIDKTAAIHMGCFFTGGWLKVGAHSVINRNCYLDCREQITIGSNVSISPECYLITAGHDPQSAGFKGKNAALSIDDNVWLGARVVVLPGADLGKGAVAAAGAVVTKRVEPWTIVGGNPAKFIKNRNPNVNYTLNWFPFFDTDVQ